MTKVLRNSTTTAMAISAATSIPRPRTWLCPPVLLRSPGRSASVRLAGFFTTGNRPNRTAVSVQIPSVKNSTGMLRLMDSIVDRPRPAAWQERGATRAVHRPPGEPQALPPADKARAFERETGKKAGCGRHRAPDEPQFRVASPWLLPSEDWRHWRRRSAAP